MGGEQALLLSGGPVLWRQAHLIPAAGPLTPIETPIPGCAQTAPEL